MSVNRTAPPVILIVAACILGLSPILDAQQGDAPKLPPPASAPAGDMLQIDLGKSEIIHTPWKAARVAVTDNRVADVQVLSPDQVLVQAKALGATDVIIWNDREQARRMQLQVVINLDVLRGELRRMFPRSRLEVAQARDVLMIAGSLDRAEQAVTLRKFMDVLGVKYVDLTRVSGVQQVQLQVRIAEASRTAIRALTINTFVGGSDFFAGARPAAINAVPIAPIFVAPASGADIGGRVPLVLGGAAPASSVTLFGGFPRVPLEFFLQALAENQYMRVLAEPNLVAVSGEEASFLAGGEYPIPIAQANSTGGVAITIEYREFGVRLKFRPVVLGDGMIELHVAPEVSQLSDVGAVEVSGFRVPSLITRRAETTLQLKNGQTFGMAGLIQQTTAARSSRVPGLGDLPVLGALFRSVRYENNETELVVLVTANVVEPMNESRLPAPGASHLSPNDWELYALGRIDGTPPMISCESACEIKQMGLDRLKGPGAWDCYDEPAPARRPMGAYPATQPENR
jgi:pilus assembly protein CpaC